MNELWAVMAWSLNILSHGEWPALDWKGRHFVDNMMEKGRSGKALAGPWRGCVAVLDLSCHWG
eukprot:4690232-Amphidinium_carterae.1